MRLNGKYADQKTFTVPMMYELAFAPASTTSTSYAVVGSFIFRGTSLVGTPSKIKVIAYTNTAGATGAIRIVNKTTGLVICENAAITATATTIYDLGGISNLPTGETILELQLKRTGGTNSTSVICYFLQIQWG